MKIVLALFLLIFWLQNFAQDTMRILYEIRGMYTRPVKLETLTRAKTMADLCPGYPAANWITQYTGTEISTTMNGKQVKAEGLNDTLSPGQINLFAATQLGNNLDFVIKYTYINSITGNNDAFEMDFTLTAVPDKEAQFIGGPAKMDIYLKKNAINKIRIHPSAIQPITIRFTIDEKGEITNVLLQGSCSDKNTDKLILKAIRNMPPWQPAQNSNGETVKQNFEFILYNQNIRGGC
jgi:TonB family protein